MDGSNIHEYPALSSDSISFATTQKDNMLGGAYTDAKITKIYNKLKQKKKKTEEFFSQLQKKFVIKVINLGQLNEGETEYDILGVGVIYMINRELSFGIEKSLNEKKKKKKNPIFGSTTEQKWNIIGSSRTPIRKIMSVLNESILKKKFLTY